MSGLAQGYTGERGTKPGLQARHGDCWAFVLHLGCCPLTGKGCRSRSGLPAARGVGFWSHGAWLLEEEVVPSGSEGMSFPGACQRMRCLRAQQLISLGVFGSGVTSLHLVANGL